MHSGSCLPKDGVDSVKVLHGEPSSCSKPLGSLPTKIKQRRVLRVALLTARWTPRVFNDTVFMAVRSALSSQRALCAFLPMNVTDQNRENGPSLGGCHVETGGMCLSRSKVVPMGTRVARKKTTVLVFFLLIFHPPTSHHKRAAGCDMFFNMLWFRQRWNRR